MKLVVSYRKKLRFRDNLGYAITIHLADGMGSEGGPSNREGVQMYWSGDGSQAYKSTADRLIEVLDSDYTGSVIIYCH